MNTNLIHNNMKKITLFISFIFSGIIFSQTLEMPNIPAEGVNYETLTFDSYLTIPTTGPWDFSNITAQFQESDIEMIPIASTEYSGQYPNSTHVKTSMFGTQLVEQFPGFTESGYTYNGENSVIITNYSTPLVLHPYPFSVGDTHSDGIYDVPFTCNGCPPAMYRDHEITSEAVASGSVTMPDGTVYENVVLVNHVAVFSDGQTGSSPCIITRNSSFLWAEDLGIPLVETYTQSYGTFCPPLATENFSRFYEGQTEIVDECEGILYSLPYLYDFQDASIWDCNYFYDSDNDGNSWGIGVMDEDGDGLNNNRFAVSASWISGIGAVSPDNWIIVGPIDLTQVTDANMTWDVRGIDSSWCQENYTVYVGTEPTPSNLTASSISYNETILAFGPMADACGVSWASRSLDISAASGTEAYIGFRHHAVSDMFQLHIDDLAVTSESLSTGDLPIENLNYHYDNDLDKLFINSDEILSNIKIYDLLGKEVISKAININSASIDLTNLKDAIYIVNVKSRNSRTSTFKIVKN